MTSHPSQHHQYPQTPPKPSNNNNNQNAPNSPYEYPNSPIASVAQRPNKSYSTQSPQASQHSSNVYYQVSTPQHVSSQQQHSQSHQHTPGLFSPGFSTHGPQNQLDQRHKHPHQVSTRLIASHIPYLSSFGQTAEKDHPLNFSYAPPCMHIVHQLVKSYNDLAGDNPNSVKQDASNTITEQFALKKDELQPFYLIKQLPALPRTPRKSPIPPKQLDAPRITLALDLDETLVHSTLQAQQCSFSFTVNYNAAPLTIYVNVRPHLEYFLRTVSQWFEVVIFTASQKSYADTLLNMIDPMNEYISHRVFRDSCVQVDNNYIKDLSILGRNLEHVILVDNSFQAFGYHLANGVPIESWFTEESDVELLNLVPLLRHLKDVHDVRPYLNDLFHLQEFVNFLPLHDA